MRGGDLSLIAFSHKERGREGHSERRTLEFDSIFSQREREGGRETVRGGDWSLIAFSHKERGREGHSERRTLEFDSIFSQREREGGTQ